MYHQTRDGRQILIKDMTTQHILNTVKCVEGNISRKYLAELLLRTKQYQNITNLLEEIRDDEVEDEDNHYEEHYGFLSYSETF